MKSCIYKLSWWVVMLLMLWLISPISSYGISSIKNPIPSITSSKLPTIWDQDIFFSSDTIQDIVNVSTSYEQFHAIIRILTVKQLIKYGYTDFKTKPYYQWNWAMRSSQDMKDFGVSQVVPYEDHIDVRIRNQFGNLKTNWITAKSNSRFNYIYIPKTTWEYRNDIFLFKNDLDLKDLWYKVISRRTRINKDLEYRRFNISTAFQKFGNVRVINPGESIDYLSDIAFDSNVWVNYKYGKSVVLDEEIDTYGGGICWSSTAVYQGILTNKSLERTQVRNHSQWYNSLYFATINDKYVTTPGIDSTVYEWTIDLKFKNISTHPIVVIANYDGSYGGVEEVFTLSWELDRGEFSYVGKSSSTCKVMVNKKQTTKACNCYTWLINDMRKTSCYKMENGK